MSRYKHIPSKLQQAFSQLGNLYKEIPETIGCLENIDKEIKPCKARCCENQNPQLLYCEFLNAWNFILKNWILEDVLKLIERSIRNYLNDLPIKGCVCWNEETKLCNIHKKRPLSCYLYGITPDQEFNNRLMRLREIYKDDQRAIFMKQCKMVRTKDGEEITEEDTDGWWDKLCDIEHSIGIDRKLITDEPDGTYRTYHDHILIYLLPEYLLENLSHVRKFGDDEEKETVVVTFINILSNVMRDSKNGETDKDS